MLAYRGARLPAEHTGGELDGDAYKRLSLSLIDNHAVQRSKHAGHTGDSADRHEEISVDVTSCSRNCSDGCSVTFVKEALSVRETLAPARGGLEHVPVWMKERKSNQLFVCQ